MDDSPTETTYAITTDTVTSRAIGSTVGSGIAGDGLMGIINFSLDASGNMSVNTFNMDTMRFVGENFYTDALGTNGTNNMTGTINSSGDVTFTPTGREGLWEAGATVAGVQEWSRDSISGLYDTLTTGTSSNRAKGTSPAFTMTGTALSDDGMGGWTGTLVSAANINGATWQGFNNVQTSELWNISIISAVPIPTAFWLFGSGLLGLIGIARRKKIDCERP